MYQDVGWVQSVLEELDIGQGKEDEAVTFQCFIPSNLIIK
jgi:hypothetical protein